MTIETLKSPNPGNRNGISVIKSKFLSVSSMNTLLAILKVTDARRDVILAGGLYHRFPWRHLPPSNWATVIQLQAILFYDHLNFIEVMNKRHHTIFANNYDIFQWMCLWAKPSKEKNRVNRPARLLRHIKFRLLPIPSFLAGKLCFGGFLLLPVYLLPTSHPSEDARMARRQQNRAAQDWAIGRKILDRASLSIRRFWRKKRGKMEANNLLSPIPLARPDTQATIELKKV